MTAKHSPHQHHHDDNNGGGGVSSQSSADSHFGGDTSGGGLWIADGGMVKDAPRRPYGKGGIVDLL